MEGAGQHGWASDQYAYGWQIRAFGALAAAPGGAVVEHSGFLGRYDWVLDVSGYFVP